MNNEFPEPLYRHGVPRPTKAWRQRKERYRLLGSRCNACGTYWWPGRKVCGKCNSRDLADYQFNPVGELVAHHAGRLPWYVPPIEGFDVYGDQRAMVMVKLQEGAYVGPTDVVDCPLADVKDGMKVRKVLRKLRREANGSWQYGYMWIPEEP